eukprot:CAMPEP_0172614246 /NCGR_PEP_ID=MMETSP1068-20121228/49283_1 /TAXON_ID=35684 /ORGANISM="Pseudopedinella elastica, Strain CCMP716" /LENGTH=196 /DNA_ID=CAMNT_0013418965 /DNA_START=631 /DNA_END=1224 /DNA_ORIENTATION=+
MRATPAVAWKDSHSESVPVDVYREVCVPDARSNEVLEVRVMCSQEKSGKLKKSCRGTSVACAGIVVRQAAVLAMRFGKKFFAVAWVELVEASRDVPYSVLLDLLALQVECFSECANLRAAIGEGGEAGIRVIRVLLICAENRLEERVGAFVSVSFFTGTADEVARHHVPCTNGCCRAHEVAHLSQSKAFVSCGERE